MRDEKPDTGFGYWSPYFNSISYAPGLGDSVTSIWSPDVVAFLYLGLMFAGLGRAPSFGRVTGSMLTLYQPSGAPSRPLVIRLYVPSMPMNPIAPSLEVFPLLSSGVKVTVPVVSGCLLSVT